MKNNMLLWDETIFRDPVVLELDYLPEQFIHRDSQLQSLIYSLKPAVKGMRPINCLVYGPPGTGKTSAVLKVFEEIEAHTSDVVLVKINCQMDSTRFAVVSRIYRKLFNIDPPSSGVAFRKLFEKIVLKLIEKDRAMVVCLDDINYLFHGGHADEIMYSILRAHEQYPGVKMGVIAIVSDTGKLYKFDPKVSSVFLPEEIEFPPYSYDEIGDIISSRIQLAFYPEVVPDQVREKIVNYVDVTGDLRVGIDLLKRSGLNAEKRASKNISEDDVDKAYESSRLLHLRRNISSLSENEKEILRLVAENDEIKAGELFELFRGNNELGYTRFYGLVNKLKDSHYLDVSFSGEGKRGRTRIIRLNYPADDVIKCIRG
jgi:cell division control protein 6